ncbi:MULTISPECIES: hypothetical protein [unclassified Meiothermus]|uniref:hypothetical protein n=1 Tax=unclassified Meiothermus TaxID=370471 RepID=UPI000D7D1BA6|nr:MULTISPECIES: hypothetical protein [unclassified Meiothermus]PZA05894.1 hypothetical protein DNA98_16230 [Meiothermus sp. Pnk-1]RYM32012.1 hypothetical protein EWH23_14485 [Meiothermus sp. PNK-Is4]
MSLYQTLQQSLEPLLGSRTQTVLEEGVRRLGVSPESLQVAQAETLLKRLVYRELQATRPASEARQQIESLLQVIREQEGVSTKPAAPPPPVPIPSSEPPLEPLPAPVRAEARPASLADLEAGLKRMGLYLEWPEVSRLRSLVMVIKREQEKGVEPEELLREGQGLLVQLEERLQAALLRQTRDISDLEAALNRVSSVGGPKVRRLEALLRQIKEAHASETLAPGEVERARSIAAELRKLVESSVVQNPTLESRLEPEVPVPDETAEFVMETPPEPPRADGSPASERYPTFEIDFGELTEEQLGKIREIDVAEDRRALETLKERYAGVLSRSEVAPLLERLEAQLATGEPLGAALPEFEAKLKAALKEALSEARARYEWLAERLRELGHEPLEELAPKLAGVTTRLNVAFETLQAGVIPEDLAALGEALEALAQEAKSLREQKAREARLRQALDTLRGEAEAALSAYRGQPTVEVFFNQLAGAQPREESLQVLRRGLSGLLEALAREREEENLRRSSLRSALQALPSLDSLEPQRSRLLAELNDTSKPLAELEAEMQRLVREFQGQVSMRLEALRRRSLKLGFAIPGLESALNALQSGQVPDPQPLERALEEVLTQRRNALLAQLAQLEGQAQALRGVGGEAVLSEIAQFRSRLQAGELPDLTPLHETLRQAQRALEVLRGQLQIRIASLLVDYHEQATIGGETVFRLRPMIEFLAAAQERMGKLGVNGLLDVRRTLEEALPLAAQLQEEYQAAQRLKEELKGVNIDELLGIFESKPAKEEKPIQHPALASFQGRGVEGLALLGPSGLIEGHLPFPISVAQALLEDFRRMGEDLGWQPARLAVLSLPETALILAPLGQKGLVVLAEKGLLSKLLTQIEKHRDELAAM